MSVTFPENPKIDDTWENPETNEKFVWDNNNWTPVSQVLVAGGDMTGTLVVPDTGINSGLLTVEDAVEDEFEPDMTAWIGYPPSNDNNEWQSVTYSEEKGLFVAVAYNGSNKVMYSENGVSWTGVASSNESINWNSVTYGDGKFVAVGYRGSGNRVMYSEDAITWTGVASSNDSTEWYDVTYGDGKFVAVAQYGSNKVMHSEDAITWTGLPFDSNEWFSVTYGDGKFVAVAYTGSDRVMYSEDGIAWTRVSGHDSNGWESVTYGNGKFVAVAGNGSGNRVMYSEDGVTWTSVDTGSNDSVRWIAVTYGDGNFVAVGEGSKGTMYSEDGITWTAVTPPGTNRWKGVTYGAGKFVAVANSISKRVMVLDTEPLSNNLNIHDWEEYPQPGLTYLWAIAYAEDKDIFVAVSRTGTNRFMYSEDGYNWVDVKVPSHDWVSVTYGGGKFVAVAKTTKTTAYSEDGINWEFSTAINATSWFGVEYGDGKFVAVAQGTVSGTRSMYSLDGITWKTGNNVPNKGWLDVVYSEEKKLWVAVAYTQGGSQKAAVMYSADGIDWTLGDTPENLNWWSVTYGDGKFVAVAGNGSSQIMYSEDGISWTKVSSPQPNSYLRGITYGQGLFVAVSQNGSKRIMYSENGVEWKLSNYNATHPLTDVVSTRDKFLIVAEGASSKVLVLESEEILGNLHWNGEEVKVSNGGMSTSSVSRFASTVSSRLGKAKYLQDSAPPETETLVISEDSSETFDVTYDNGELWYQPSTNTLHIRDSDEWVSLFQ